MRVIRSLFFALLALAPAAVFGASSAAFVGASKFSQLVGQAENENWRLLPIGERVGRIGIALAGTPYQNYTLEIHDRREEPCVNMTGMDCWTFFEIALGTARALKVKEDPQPGDLLAMIEMDRYRGGKCNGVFTSRLHYLEDWLYDNERRGLVKDITPALPGARKIHRELKDMSVTWRSSRQLRANRELIPVMARIERNLSERGIWYVPKASVPAAEKHLRTGDIVCIVTNWPYDYTSHVGVAYRDKSGTLRFLHASRDHRKVILDSRLSSYLNEHRKQAGIMVGRPADVSPPQRLFVSPPASASSTASSSVLPGT